MDRPRWLAGAVLATGGLALAACGTVAAPTGPSAGGGSPAASSASPSPAETSAACSLSAVTISLDSAVSGAAAGSSFVPLEFENVSASPCTLPPFPAVTFAAGPSGPDIGLPAVQQDKTVAQAVVLAPGKFAHAWLQIAAAANYPAAQCHPVAAQGLLVTLTGTAGAHFVADTVQACAQPPAGSAVLSVFPVRAGPARQGVVP